MLTICVAVCHTVKTCGAGAAATILVADNIAKAVDNVVTFILYSIVVIYLMFNNSRMDGRTLNILKELFRLTRNP